MIIDAHVHVHPEKDGIGSNYDASAQNLLDNLNDSPVHRALLLPVEPKMSNEFVASLCDKYPDRLAALVSVNPTEGARALSQLDEYIGGRGFKGVKLHPRWQGWGLAQADEAAGVVAEAARRGGPVLIDTLPYSEAIYRTRCVELAAALAERVPDANLIMAHMGGHQLFDAFLIAKAHPKVYLDFSLTLRYYEGSSIETDAAFVIKRIGAHRCIYGSDHPQYELAQNYEWTCRWLDAHGFGARETDDLMGRTIGSLIDF